MTDAKSPIRDRDGGASRDRPARPPFRKLVKNMRLSVQENSSPYGFSVMITGTYALLSTRSRPEALDVIAGAAGAASAFMLAELLALTILKREAETNSQRTRLIGRLLSFVSIGSGIGVAYLCAAHIDGALGWLAAGAAGSFAYLLLDGVALAIADYRAHDG